MKQCKTPNCTKQAIMEEKYCMKCIKIQSDIQSRKMIPEMLKSLRRIEVALANNQMVPTQQQSKNIEQKVKQETADVFIPTINIPDVEVKGDKNKTENIESDLASIAEKLGDMGE